MPKTYTVPPPPHHNEGKTVAAWTMNLGIVLGSVPIAAGLILPDLDILLWIGAAIVLLAIVVGVVMSRVGLGQPRHYGHPVVAETRTEETPAEAGAR
jgi:sugar phosphate permease